MASFATTVIGAAAPDPDIPTVMAWRLTFTYSVRLAGGGEVTGEFAIPNAGGVGLDAWRDFVEGKTRRIDVRAPRRQRVEAAYYGEELCYEFLDVGEGGTTASFTAPASFFAEKLRAAIEAAPGLDYSDPDRVCDEGFGLFD